jgi:hypothetical protein
VLQKHYAAAMDSISIVNFGTQNMRCTKPLRGRSTFALIAGPREVASTGLWCVRLLQWMREGECINLHAGFENFPHGRVRLKVATV